MQEFYQIKRSLDESSQLSAGLGDLVKRWRKFDVGADVDVDVDVGVDVAGVGVGVAVVVAIVGVVGGAVCRR